MRHEIAEAIRKKAWLDQNRETYAGQWVALTDGTLCGVGDTAEVARQQAEHCGLEPWFVFWVPPEEGQSPPISTQDQIPQLTDAERKARLAALAEDYFTRRDQLMRRLAAGVDEAQEEGTT